MPMRRSIFLDETPTEFLFFAYYALQIFCSSGAELEERSPVYNPVRITYL